MINSKDSPWSNQPTWRRTWWLVHDPVCSWQGLSWNTWAEWHVECQVHPVTKFPLKEVLGVNGVLGPRARAKSFNLEPLTRARGPRTPFTPRTPFKGNCVLCSSSFYLDPAVFQSSGYVEPHDSHININQWVREGFSHQHVRQINPSYLFQPLID